MARNKNMLRYFGILITIFSYSRALSALETFSLNADWTVSTEYQNISIPKQTVPIGSYSVLEINGFAGPIYESYNDVNLRYIAGRGWKFQTEFATPSSVHDHSRVILIFFGIDTISTIRLNGQVLGRTDNMFVRYQYDVKDALLASGEMNSLVVDIENPIQAASDLASKNSFTPPNCPPAAYHGECHMNFLRKMQASFAWDWGLAAPSVGLWKDVQLQVFDVATIRDVTIAAMKLKSGNWHLRFNVYLDTDSPSSSISGELEVLFPGINNSKVTKSVESQSDGQGELVVDVDFDLAEEDVELWWPNGAGLPTLYDVNVSFTPKQQQQQQPHQQGQANEKDKKTFRIGFRTIKLVQEPIGAGLSFYFEVNGHPLFMKGSNWIPADILPERSADRRRVKYLLKAARDANMNMLRVWGGGVYESDYFYELADEYGILIWQDLMFGCAMYPVFDEFLASVRSEIRQNVRRLQHHASIALYATNNENEVALVQNWYGTNKEATRFRSEYRKLYIEVVKQTVEENDKWRTCLSSSPSNGLKTVQDDFISSNPQDTNFGDIHYYNYMADGWNWSIYPKPRFASEYGFQSYPALSSWGAAAGGDDYLPDLMKHRQHSPMGEIPILSLINKHLPPLSAVADQEQVAVKIYFSQIAQAMAIKAETELYRTLRSSFANTMGALYWQLNDVWIAPSWSSIDFYGKFKILHHYARKFFELTSIVPIKNAANIVEVHVVNDILRGDSDDNEDDDYTAVMRLFNWKDLQRRDLMSWRVKMVPNAAVKLDSVPMWNLFNNSVPADEHFLQFTLTDAHDKVVSSNYIFPVPLKDIQGVDKRHAMPEVAISTDVCDGFEQKLTLSVRTAAPILFFYLDILNEGVKEYQLSDNGFVIVEPITMLTVTYPNVDCRGTQLALEDIKVYTVNQYII